MQEVTQRLLKLSGGGFNETVPAERGAQAGMDPAAAAALPSAGRPPLSGTAPIMMLFTVASNLPLSPLVALQVTAITSPEQLHDIFLVPFTRLCSASSRLTVIASL